MCGEHRQQAALLLEQAQQLAPNPFRPQAERQAVLTEALVHAVLHLAEEVSIHTTITREQ